MAYSSFVEEKTGRSQYTKLEIELYAASLSSKDVYLVNAKTQKVPSKSVRINDGIDVVIAGSEEAITRFAQRLQGAVGIVKYEGQPVEQAHTQAVVARDIAEEGRKKHHFYQQGVD